jgi:hypothetical protein
MQIVLIHKYYNLCLERTCWSALYAFKIIPIMLPSTIIIAAFVVLPYIYNNAL